ncbi:diacylglycerol/lipid kinase family protein [Jeotgalibaca sp. A127]|uniref:diacylglycerol/lipid kinase family protein n=1 Tax=Jeotgalibaca sp. A127 TaxID=3457324 RepID=UPI003FD1D46B
MDMCYHIIANFNAGAGKGKRIGLDVEKIMQEKAVPFQFYQTKYPNHAYELAQELGESLDGDTDRIIVIGGDGTLHEAIGGLNEAKSELPIGYLPAGTGNDFARSIGLTKDVKKGLRAILKAVEPEEIECMKYYDHITDKDGIALNSMGFGLDAEVNALASDTKSEKNGGSVLGLENSSYLNKIIGAFKERKTYSVAVTIDGRTDTYHDVLVTGVMNHPYFGGGIKIDPQSASNNHELAVMLIFDLSFLTLLRLLPLLLTTGSHAKTRYFKRIPGKNITIKLHRPVLGQADGEVLPPAAYHMDYALTTFKLWK